MVIFNAPSLERGDYSVNLYPHPRTLGQVNDKFTALFIYFILNHQISKIYIHQIIQY